MKRCSGSKAIFHPSVGISMENCPMSPTEPSLFSYFYKQEPTKEQVELLVLANPNNPNNQVTVDRPLTPQRLPAPNPMPPAEPTPLQPQQLRPRVGYVDTNTIQAKPKRQWPRAYPEGKPSWFKNRNNQ